MRSKTMLQHNHVTIKPKQEEAANDWLYKIPEETLEKYNELNEYGKIAINAIINKMHQEQSKEA